MSRRRAALAMVTRRIRRALLAAAVIVAALLATAGSAGATPEAKWVQGYFTFDGAGVYPTADGGQPLWTGKPGEAIRIECRRGNYASSTTAIDLAVGRWPTSRSSPTRQRPEHRGTAHRWTAHQKRRQFARSTSGCCYGRDSPTQPAPRPQRQRRLAGSVRGAAAALAGRRGAEQRGAAAGLPRCHPAFRRRLVRRHRLGTPSRCMSTWPDCAPTPSATASLS